MGRPRASVYASIVQRVPSRENYQYPRRRHRGNSRRSGILADLEYNQPARVRPALLCNLLAPQSRILFRLNIHRTFLTIAILDNCPTVTALLAFGLRLGKQEGPAVTA